MTATGQKNCDAIGQQFYKIFLLYSYLQYPSFCVMHKSWCLFTFSFSLKNVNCLHDFESNVISEICMPFVDLMLARGGVDEYLLRPTT